MLRLPRGVSLRTGNRPARRRLLGALQHAGHHPPRPLPVRRPTARDPIAPPPRFGPTVRRPLRLGGPIATARAGPRSSGEEHFSPKEGVAGSNPAGGTTHNHCARMVFGYSPTTLRTVSETTVRQKSATVSVRSARIRPATSSRSASVSCGRRRVLAGRPACFPRRRDPLSCRAETRPRSRSSASEAAGRSGRW